MVHVFPYEGKSPSLADDVFLAPGSCLFGDVRLAKGVSFWCNSVARGDVNTITIGKDTNIQDLCVLHVHDDAPLKIGEQVTIGHRAILHGCSIGDRCLIGMGAIILDHVEIGEECLIAAGALISEGTKISPGSLVMGIPGRIKRNLTKEERKKLIHGSQSYLAYAKNYLKVPDFPKIWK